MPIHLIASHSNLDDERIELENRQRAERIDALSVDRSLHALMPMPRWSSNYAMDTDEWTVDVRESVTVEERIDAYRRIMGKKA